MPSNGDGNKSTQKLPKHDSYASQTQDSYDHSASKPYNSGAKSGAGGSKRDPDGPAKNPAGSKYLND